MSTEDNRKTKTRHNATMYQYVSYELTVCGKPLFGDFHPVLNSVKLIQQLIVDYYCYIESHKQKYIHNRQDQLRIDTYVGLTDAARAKAGDEKLKAV